MGRKEIVGGREIARKFIGTQEIRAQYCGDTLFWEKDGRRFGKYTYAFEWKDELYITIYVGKAPSTIKMLTEGSMQMHISFWTETYKIHLQRKGIHLTRIYLQKDVPYNFAFTEQYSTGTSTERRVTNLTRILSPIPKNIIGHCLSPGGRNFYLGGELPFLYELPEDLFEYHRGLVNISTMFQKAPNLKTIPKNLFQGMTDLDTAISIFNGSGIENIPEDLFRDCINLREIAGAFAGTNITTIPERLFSNNEKVEDFAYIFAGTNITTIPENLFSNNGKAVDFSNAFEGANITTIPKGLFDCKKDCAGYWYIVETFKNCKRLTYASPELLDFLTKNNGEEMKKCNYAWLFEGCENLAEAPKLWVKIVEDDGFEHIVMGRDTKYAYRDCKSLPWYDEIPAFLK